MMTDSLFAAGKPFFLYDLKVLRENLQSLNRTLGAIYFSVKSNPNAHLLRELRKLAAGFDVSSRLELEMLLKMDVPSSTVTVSGPGKSNEFLQFAVESGVQSIHVDSIEELALLDSSTVKICLRIADESAAGGKLGLSAVEIERVLASNSGRRISGFHAYLGAENFSEEKILRFIRSGETFRKNFPDRFTADFAYYLGPGLPRMDLFEAAGGLNEIFVNVPAKFECGRAIVGNSALYFCPVLSVKERGSRQVVIVNGGVQHLNVQLFSRKVGDRGIQTAVYRGGRIHRSDLAPTSVYGSLCTDNDVLHPNLALPKDIRRGDWLMLGPCGAYNITASANQFIGQPMADEWLIDSGLGPAGNEAKNISPRAFKAYHETFHD